MLRVKGPQVPYYAPYLIHYLVVYLNIGAGPGQDSQNVGYTRQCGGGRGRPYHNQIAHIISPSPDFDAHYTALHKEI